MSKFKPSGAQLANMQDAPKRAAHIERKEHKKQMDRIRGHQRPRVCMVTTTSTYVNPSVERELNPTNAEIEQDARIAALQKEVDAFKQKEKKAKWEAHVARESKEKVKKESQYYWARLFGTWERISKELYEAYKSEGIIRVKITFK